MTLKIALICISALICLVRAQQSSTTLDDLINNIFNTKPDGQGGSTQPPVVIKPTPTISTNVNSNQGPDIKYKSCGAEKECVPSFLCKNDTISTDGIGIIDIRIDGQDCEYLEVCCDIPNKTKTPIVTIEKQHEGCGYRNPYGVGFKITGAHDNEANFGEFPWMVAILRREETPGEELNLYECGGALIAPTIILTASHCVQSRDPKTLFVRAGEWDTQTTSEVLPHQDRHVKEVIIHDQFNKGSLFNDVALLILDSPFEYDENIRPICLPESDVTFDYSRCYATGWGKDKFGKEGTYQVILKRIDLPVVPRNQCQESLRRTRLGRYFQLHESFICAGGEKDKDTCKGDGGSPLVCPIPGVEDRFYQAGIVAWGIGCGVENIPGVYASIPHLRPWINQKLSARGIEFSHFTA